ncbi:major facilitator superfamily domain-containing protein [Coniochaeta sp. 2T2.1]|nr:major facilitator superfamily domain-containing protein [Coniochaeta sp. 2T2.1]
MDPYLDLEKDLEPDLLPDTASSDSDIQPAARAPAPDTTTLPPKREATSLPDSDVSPIPDGGLPANLQVLSSFSCMVATWGLVNTFGVFQTYYTTTLLSHISASSISWIGSIQACLLLLLGLVSGPLYDKGYFRLTISVGLGLIVFGMFMTSLAHRYWQLLLAQGVCVGVGMGLTFLPSTAVLSQWFDRRRALAIAFASVGSPLAGIVFPIIFSRLVGRVGFGWATRTIAFIVLGLAVVPVVFMRVRVRVPPKGNKRPLVDRSAVRDPAFVLYALGGFASFLVLYVPFFYTQLYTIAHGIAEDDFAPYLVTFLNVGSVLGRIIPGLAADRWGSLNTTIICTLVSAVLAFGWIGCHNLGGLTVFALLYGMFSGGVVGLAPSVMVGLTPDLTMLGARMGMSFAVNGVAVLVGSPIAGAILGDGHWTSMIVFTGCFLTAAVALYAASMGFVWRVKGGFKG